MDPSAARYDAGACDCVDNQLGVREMKTQLHESCSTSSSPWANQSKARDFSPERRYNKLVQWRTLRLLQTARLSWTHTVQTHPHAAAMYHSTKIYIYKLRVSSREWTMCDENPEINQHMALLSSPIAHNHAHTPCTTQLLMFVSPVCVCVCAAGGGGGGGGTWAALWEDKNIKTQTRSHVYSLCPSIITLLFSLTLTADLNSLKISACDTEIWQIMLTFSFGFFFSFLGCNR